MATPPSSITARDLRAAMSHFATGVTIVTAEDDAGRRGGATVCSVASLSLDPPLVLVCLNRTSKTLGLIQRARAFAINVLTDGQRSVADAFARSGNAAAWDGLSVHAGLTGAPLLAGTAVAVDCALHDLLDGGDHLVVVGRVVGVVHGDDAEPLLVHRGSYVDRSLHCGSPVSTPATTSSREVPVDEPMTASCRLPTDTGTFQLVAHERRGGQITAALVYGDPAEHPRPVVSAHVACVLGDVFGSHACDCGDRLAAARDEIVRAGAGVLLYTKRDSDALLKCGRLAGPDLESGSVLLDRIGVRRVAVLEAESIIASALGAEAVLVPLVRAA